jgi:two-component system CheB/CheR fusion protein
MPAAAIAAGVVDLVLSASEIASFLFRLRDRPAHADSPQDDKALADILELLRVRTSHDFRHYKHATVLRRLHRRLQVNGLPDLASYRDHLREHVEETRLLLQDMLISVTSFFRDPASMESLARNVLTGLLARDRHGDEPIRVWVAGCASGEEAYSVSILLHELAAPLEKPPAIQIFATDIDDRALAVARAGVYPAAIASDVSASRLAEFFIQEEQSYRVSPMVRESVLFASHNILQDAAFSRLDLILCRNLLIYLDQRSQSTILDTFRRALRLGGHLFLGKAETAEPACGPGTFNKVDEKNRIYVVDSRAPEPTAVDRAVGSTVDAATEATHLRERPHPAREEGRELQDAAQLHQRILLDSAPASVLVDADLNILHMSSGAGQYMVHTAGAPNAGLLSNIHPDLRLELRAALLSTSESGAPVYVRQIPVAWQRGSGHERGRVDLRVIPHREQSAPGAIFCLITFETVPLPEPASDKDPDGSRSAASADLVAENDRLKEQLRQTVAQFERSSQAFRSSNVELAAANAALIGVRDELQTRKEELQSMNEEMITLNRELRAKTEEAGQIKEDLQNLSAAGPIIALFVDRGLNVRRLTPAATGVLGLGSAGAARTLQDVARHLHEPALDKDATQTLRTLQPAERTVSGIDGRSYLIRMQPYRTMRDSIEGLVLNFIDVTSLQQAKRELRDADEVLRLIAESLANQAVIRLDQQGRITSWNAAAGRLFGYRDLEITGQSFEALADTEERDRRGPETMIRLAREQGSAEREQMFRRKDGGTFVGICSITSLHGDPANGFVHITRDLSDLREAQFERDQLFMRERSLDGRLSAARRRQDELFHELAGELRRPLNLVQVNAEMLMRLPETRGIAVVGKVASSIGKAVATQANIIDSLRDLSLARSGKLVLQMRPVDLAELVKEVVKGRQEQAAAKSLMLEFRSDGPQLTTICDSSRIEQVVRNLLDNAIKFTDHGGVSVSLVAEKENARLSVSDTGRGLAPEFLETVFDPYDQSDSGSPRGHPGLGIGLPLVRELVTAHDGLIAAESEGVGRGATFTVWLPLAEPLQPSPGEPAGDAANPLKDLRVVLVDDSVDLLTAFGALLTLEGARVESFGNGEAALKRLLEGNVDLLISDLGMPG